MKVLIITSHPWDGSYNYALRQSVENGLKKSNTTYEVLDLVKDQFNPVMTDKDLAVYSKGKFVDPKVGEYQKKIEESDLIVFVFPVWWGLFPAILKGFLDKILLPGWAFNTGMLGSLIGLIKGKKAVVISTMNTPKFLYHLYLFAPLKNAFIRNTLKMVGIKKVKWFELYRVLSVSNEKRKNWLSDIEHYFCRIH